MQQTGTSLWEGWGLTRAALVMFKSFITSSKAAVSSACFWLCKAIFSLNLRGLLEDAIFPSSCQWNVTLRTTPGPRTVVTTHGRTHLLMLPLSASAACRIWEAGRVWDKIRLTTGGIVCPRCSLLIVTYRGGNKHGYARKDNKIWTQKKWPGEN